MNTVEGGVDGAVYVGRNAFTVAEDDMAGNSVGAAEIHGKVGKHFAVHTGGAVGAGFLLIRKAGNRGVFRVCGKYAGKLAVGADSVVMTVGADKASVKADVPGFSRRNHGKLRRLEVLLHNAIFIEEKVCNVEFNLLAYRIISERNGADEDIKLLAADAVAELSVHLLLCKVREQIGNAENRVVLVLADIDGDGGAVLANNNTVERQRNGGPLISLDAAVVVGLKERKLLVLVKGVRLQVKAGGVDVRRRNVKSFFERTAADFRKEERFVAVVYVDLVACNIFFARLKGNKALFFEHGNAPVDELAFGFAGADELFVVFAVIIGFGYLLL